MTLGTKKDTEMKRFLTLIPIFFSLTPQVSVNEIKMSKTLEKIAFSETSSGYYIPRGSMALVENVLKRVRNHQKEMERG